MDQDGRNALPQNEGQGAVSNGGRSRCRREQIGDDGGRVEGTPEKRAQGEDNMDEGDLSLEDASDGDDCRMAHDHELKDDASDDECDGAPESLDDERQSEYVSSLTLPRAALPRAAQPSASSGGTASTAVVQQEPGSDVHIREDFRKFVKDNQFERAAAAADATDLSLQQAAEREAHILKVSTREDRSPRSFEAINRAASLFIVWMKTRVDLHESADRSEASIFYPSAFKMLKFIDWQVQRASLALLVRVPRMVSTTPEYNGIWADHLRFVDPKRFGDCDASPHLSDLVRMRMDILNQTYVKTVRSLGLEFVAGVAAFTAYGRDTRRKMMRSLFRRHQIRHAIRLLADTNLRHAAIARGEFTRNLTFNNLAMLPGELTPRLGPVATKALLVSWRTGKTMKYGRARSIMCLEDLEVILCPLFSLALLLFWRFDVLKEEVPDFTDRTKWYRERVFTFADGGEYTAKDQYAAVKRLHKEHGVGGHVVHAARVSAAQEDARNRVPPGETQAVTHMKDINGGALGTTTLVYRPLSAQSALSQSGAVGPGESSTTAAYYNPRQHVEVPDGLVKHVLPRFMDVRRQLCDGKEKGEGHMTERGTLDLVEYLRLVLVRGAVELQEEFPENWLLKRFPFNSREFLEWAPVARNEIRQLRASDVKSRLHYQASPAIISELSRLNAKVEHMTDLLERSTATTHRLLGALASASGAERDVGDALLGPANAGSSSMLGGHGENNAPANPTTTTTSNVESSGSRTSHPSGWFYGKLPNFGACGGKRGSLSEIWQVWGGEGPGKVTGGESGFNLRAHGETSIKEQEMWGSTSNYGRYLQAGRYMDGKIAAIKAEKGFSDKDAANEMLFQVAHEKGTDTVTTWFTKFVAGGKGKKRGRDVAPPSTSDSAEA